MGKKLFSKNKVTDRSKRDLVLILLGVAVILTLAIIFDLSESFIEWSREHEFWEMDEIVLLFAIMCIALGVYSWRRAGEFRLEVTARAEAEETLLKYKSLFDSTSDLAYICDDKGKILYLNKAFESLSGQKIEDFIGDSFAPAFDEENLKYAMDLYRKTLEGEEPSCEIAFKETGRVCEYSNQPIRDSSGNIIGVMGTARDVTERKLAEKELRSYAIELETRHKVSKVCLSSAPLEETYQKIADVIYPAMGFEFLRIELYDKEREKIVVKGSKGIELPEEGPFEINLKDTLSGVVVKTGRRMIETDSLSRPEYRDERLRKLKIRTFLCVPMKVGKETIGAFCLGHSKAVEVSEWFLNFMEGLASHIAIFTERVRLEEELKRANEELELTVSKRTSELTATNKILRKEKERTQTYLRMTGSVIVVLGVDCEVKLINQKGCELLGLSEEEITGLNWIDNFIPERLRPELKEGFSELMNNKGESREFYENPILSNTGEERIISWHNTVIMEEDGKISASLNCGEDITEHLRAEEEKKELQTQILHSQKMEAIGRLTSGIAHDFNNLMTAVKTLSNLGVAKTGEGDEPFGTYFKEINNACMQAISLTRQLSIFSRKKTLALESVHINELVEKNLKGIMSSLIGEKISIRYNLSSELWRINADRSNVEQILMNLVINARDALTDNGIITIRTGNEELCEKRCVASCDMPATGKFVLIEVTDNGVGIEEEALQKIFEPFYTTKTIGKGTGLGLSVVYGIVKSLDGCINVDSKPGQGSIFKIYLPACDKESLEDESVLEEIETVEELGGEGELIFLVEDEELVYSVTRELLIDKGYRVEGAANKSEALELFNNIGSKVDLLLSDITLPDGNGIDLAGEFKKLRPKLQVILFSAHTDYKTNLPRISEEGFGFIEKPFEIKDLLTAIREKIRVNLVKN